MPPFDTEQFTDAATECVIDHGRVVNTKEKLEIIRSLSLEEIRDMLRPVTFERARTVIFKGVGSS